MTSAAIMPQLQRAQAMLQAGQAAQAWLVLAPLRSSIDRHGDALRLYALVAQAVGRIDETIEALRRIASLEGGPPEILGAIADTYGKAGRHAEAHHHWRVLAAQHPHIADAHLNAAVAATQAGRHGDAVADADRGLKRFPKDPRLLATRAMALKNAGRLDESITAFAAAVAADPNRALTRQNQGVALRVAGRFEEACEAFEQAERLGMAGAQFHANWAAAALEGNMVDRARELYRKGLAEDPGHQEILTALTRLNIEYGAEADAFEHFRLSLEKRGGELPAWLDWINALLSNDRFAEAAETAERALAQYPDNALLQAMAAFGAGMRGDAAPQLERIRQVHGAVGDALLPWMALLALRAHAPDVAAGYAERVTAAHPDNQGAWATLSIAWRLLDDPREQWLCDYDRLVMEVDVTPPDGSMTAAEYAGKIAAVLDPLHKTLAPPGRSSTRGGTQTGGQLIQQPHPALRELGEAARLAAERRVAELADDPGHPFLRRKSSRLAISSSWSVRLTASGAHHESHFHEAGWMSSAYYVRLPGYSEAARRRHEGWLQLGVPPVFLGIDLEPRRVVEPKAGTLLLFPSYMLHGTVPFAKGDRLTASFDYQPA